MSQVIPEWTAQIVVTAELARALIEDQFPALAPVTLEPLGEGWDNTAYKANGAYVFRFPRREWVVALLETESRVLPVIAPRVPLSVPCPCFVGRPSDAFRYPFAGYPLIPGRTACAAWLTDSERTMAAEPLARFLTALHSIPTAEAAAAGAPGDTIGRLDVLRRVNKARESIRRLEDAGIRPDTKALTAILDAGPRDYVPRSDTLVHGDLYARHLLVDHRSQLCGIIDWGDLHIGDPALDLAIAHTFLPPSAHQPFRDTYGPIPELTWEVARLRAVWHTAIIALYAHDIGEADLLREARIALSYIVESA